MEFNPPDFRFGAAGASADPPVAAVSDAATWAGSMVSVT
jgi:hypothetical protein